ncbi:uridine kinase [Arthrobacter tumbae]|uniref:uridine kinase n=1 Tax=Arthrobacter tumbae TaxID=163874 RepID=UPI00195A5D17|nr:uridine kinase [Arthrobacter tumbae]MBM7780305.1 uridine kinase [Arthrobacter tumbae]
MISGTGFDSVDVQGALASALPYGTVLFGIDGVDGSGKTTFADSLARYLRGTGRSVIRIGLDDFHNPRSVRYRRGRTSPEGFWLDSYDYERFREWVVEPLSLGGNGRIRTACHNVETDRRISPAEVEAPPDCVVIVDGMFLHRAELDGVWARSVFLDVPFAETARRMASRDGSPPDPDHSSLRRYVNGQRLYIAERDPARKAAFVVDNSDFHRPRLINADSVSYRR